MFLINYIKTTNIIQKTYDKYFLSTKQFIKYLYLLVIARKDIKHVKTFQSYSLKNSMNFKLYKINKVFTYCMF